MSVLIFLFFIQFGKHTNKYGIYNAATLQAVYIILLYVVTTKDYAELLGLAHIIVKKLLDDTSTHK